MFSQGLKFLSDILGYEHFISTKNLDDVTGTFQEDKVKTNLLTFLDECTFAGDKRTASILKGLLSEDYRTFEATSVNKITIRNFSNYIFASNEYHVVVVEKDNRRYLVLKVNEKYAGAQTTESEAYFKRLLDVDVRHVAYLLYNRDISQFNPRSLPSTANQCNQKRENFDTVFGWTEKSLQDGFFDCEDVCKLEFDNLSSHGSDCNVNLKWDKVGGIMTKKTLYKSYTKFATLPSQKFKTVMTEAVMFKSLYKCTGARERKMGPKGKQVPCVEFKTLQDCRGVFEKNVHESEWEWNTV